MKTNAFFRALACTLIVAIFSSYSAIAQDDSAAPKKRRARTPRETASTTLNEKGWISLLSSNSLAGWKETAFPGHSNVEVTNGVATLNVGNDMTGMTWTNEVLRMNYEVVLEAMRVNGSDFFCGLTFPVEKEECSFIVGGWGGGVTGLSCIDGADAANNETTEAHTFESNHWYRLRVRVTPGKIEAWIDNEKVVDANVAGRRLSLRSEVDKSVPFGIATWRTTGAVRDLRWRKIEVHEE